MQQHSQKAFLTEATDRYAAALAGSPAQEYLESRGIGLGAASIARLGWTGDPVPGHETYAGMLSIPYRTVSGVEAVKFRVIGDRPGPRYLWPTGQKSRLYNTEAVLSGQPYVLITEGELDCVVAHYVCGLNAVGIAGVQHWKPWHSRVLKGFGNIFVVTDNDDKEDGSNPGQDLAGRIMRDIPWARNIMLPRGLDISDFVMQHGVDALAPLVGIAADEH